MANRLWGASFDSFFVSTLGARRRGSRTKLRGILGEQVTAHRRAAEGPPSPPPVDRRKTLKTAGNLEEQSSGQQKTGSTPPPPLEAKSADLQLSLLGRRQPTTGKQSKSPEKFDE